MSRVTKFPKRRIDLKFYNYNRDLLGVETYKCTRIPTCDNTDRYFEIAPEYKVLELECDFRAPVANGKLTVKFYTESDELIERNKFQYPFPYMIGLYIPYTATQVRIGCYPPEIAEEDQWTSDEEYIDPVQDR